MRPGRLPSWLLILPYLFIGLLPLLLAAAAQGRERSVAGELAVGAGLVALAMLLMQFITSGRNRRISRHAGSDTTLRFHQLTAFGLFAMVLLHPVLFMLPGSWEELGQLPRRLMMMGSSARLRSGVIALVLLAALIPMGLWRTRLPLRYELWRASHMVLALAAAIASVHHAVSTGAYSGTPALMSAWLLLGMAALGSVAYVYLIKPILLKRSAYRVKLNRQAGEGIRELVLEPAHERRLSYEAGQFVWVSFGRWAFPLNDHPYSLASSPREGGELSLMIKARGDFSSAMAAIPVGETAFVDGPYGDFRLGASEARVIALYAGGIGIAPILGILRELQAAKDKRTVRLVYGARNLDRLVGRDIIEGVERSLDFRRDYVLEEPPADWQGSAGAITPSIVLRAIAGDDPQQCLCMICGPTPMMQAIERVLLDAGVPPANIIYERFEYD